MLRISQGHLSSIRRSAEKCYPTECCGVLLGKLVEGDIIEITVDRKTLEGSVNLVGHGEEIFGAEEGARILTERPLRPDLTADADLPDDTRLWAALQDVSGGAWGGAVYDVDAILRVIEAGKKALEK